MLRSSVTPQAGHSPARAAGCRDGGDRINSPPKLQPPGDKGTHGARTGSQRPPHARPNAGGSLKEIGSGGETGRNPRVWDTPAWLIFFLIYRQRYLRENELFDGGGAPPEGTGRGGTEDPSFAAQQRGWGLGNPKGRAQRFSARTPSPPRTSCSPAPCSPDRVPVGPAAPPQPTQVLTRPHTAWSACPAASTRPGAAAGGRCRGPGPSPPSCRHPEPRRPPRAAGGPPPCRAPRGPPGG